MSKLTYEYLHREYVIRERSAREIGRMASCCTNTVLRELRRLGIAIRPRSDSQSLAASKSKKHPTRGKKRSAAVRQKIAEGVTARWRDLPNSVREAQKKRAAELWSSLSDTERTAKLEKLHKGCYIASKNGSRFERYLLVELKLSGYRTNFHKTFLTHAEQQHVDIWLPELSVGIEVDGPHHYEDVFGEERLEKRRESDALKDGLFLTNSWTLIRIQTGRRTVSKYAVRAFMRQHLKPVLDAPANGGNIVHLNFEGDSSGKRSRPPTRRRRR